MADSHRQPAKIIVQALDPSFDAIPQFDVDVLENGSSILPRLALDPRPGVVEVFGLFADQAVEVVVSAAGFLTERRPALLAPADNMMYFTLGKRGDAVTTGGRECPHPPLPPPSRARPSGESGRPGGAPAGRRAQPAAAAWQKATSASRRSARSRGASPENPREGKLVLLIHGNEEGGAYFTGEIVVTFKKLPSGAETEAAFAARLRVGRGKPRGRHRITFAMLYPGRRLSGPDRGHRSGAGMGRRR